MGKSLWTFDHHTHIVLVEHPIPDIVPPFAAIIISTLLGKLSFRFCSVALETGFGAHSSTLVRSGTDYRWEPLVFFHTNLGNAVTVTAMLEPELEPLAYMLLWWPSSCWGK